MSGVLKLLGTLGLVRHHQGVLVEGSRIPCEGTIGWTMKMITGEETNLTGLREMIGVEGKCSCQPDEEDMISVLHLLVIVGCVGQEIGVDRLWELDHQRVRIWAEGWAEGEEIGALMTHIWTGGGSMSQNLVAGDFIGRATRLLVEAEGTGEALLVGGAMVIGISPTKDM